MSPFSSSQPSSSLFSTIVRSFLKSVATMTGIAVGCILFIFLLSITFSEKKESLGFKSHYSTTIVPNGKSERKKVSAKAPVILKISIQGVIGMDKLTKQHISEMLTESREGNLKNNRVKALLLHIDTPGGTVSDSEGIYRTIKTYKERYGVPVYAYVDGLCASGGMYIASSCDKIFASDTSLVGSVGVVMPSFFNFKKLLEIIGVETKTLYAGKGKEDMNPFRSWNPGEEEQYKALIDYFYAQFVDIVSTNRPTINRNRLVNDYGAKVFSPDKAAEFGFIDGYGGSLEDTLNLLAKELGIEDDYYQVIKMDKKLQFSEIFNSDSSLMKGKITHNMEWPLGMDPKWMNQFLYLYLP